MAAKESALAKWLMKKGDVGKQLLGAASLAGKSAKKAIEANPKKATAAAAAAGFAASEATDESEEEEDKDDKKKKKKKRPYLD